MATVDKKFAERIIRHNGFYDESGEALYAESPTMENSRCVKLIEYETPYGPKAYGAVFEHDLDKNRYERESAFVKNPKVIWGYVAPAPLPKAEMSDREWAALPANLREGCTVHVPGVGDL